MKSVATKVMSFGMAAVLAAGTCFVPAQAHAALRTGAIADSPEQGFAGEYVTIIVGLDRAPYAGGADEGAAGLAGQSADARRDHEAVQAEIRDLVVNSGGAPSPGGSALGEQADEAGFGVVADYYNAFDGFAVKAPSSLVDDIRELDGVESAFVEHAYFAPESMPTEAAGASGPQSNGYSLAMTGADSVEQLGEGQVIAVIDTGVDVTHEAFRGDIPDESLAFTQDAMADARAQLSQGGKDAAYVNEKIPFAWDYGDGDSNPRGIENHGTHVAGIAVANAGQMRGVAPNAQLLAMRVARDRDKAMVDSAILAALDDAVVLKPDVVNMSLGSDGGFFDDSTNIYSRVFKTLESSGCTLCISAGNAYYSTHRDGGNLPTAANPDAATIASPSSHLESFSVASADNADVAGGERVRMSAFSSWGPTPELRMKPEITGPGGNIYSSVYADETGSVSNVQGYEFLSGTSMSSPHVAGLSALVNQYVQSDAKFAGLTPGQKHDRVTQLLMCTATPLANPDVEGSYASPRHQGAGLANVKAATETDVYATVTGALDESRPKAELGSSSEGSWTFTVELHNMADRNASFELDASALVDRISRGRFQMSPANYAGAGIEVSYAGDTFSDGVVTVPAASSANLDITVKCSEGLRSELVAQGAVNGAYVEGFVRFIAKDDAVNLSVPYLGYCGAYDEVPAFDALVDSGKTPQIFATRLVAQSGNATTPLGVNPLLSTSDDADIDLSRLVISRCHLSRDNPSCAYVARDVVSAPTSALVHSGLLRNAAQLRYVYRNEAGQELACHVFDNVAKSMTVGYNYPEADISVPAFTGYDAEGNPLPDGVYTLEEQFVAAGGSESMQSQSFAVHLDTVSPEVTGPFLEGAGDDATIVVEARDDTYLAGIDLVPADVSDDDERGYYYRWDATRAAAQQVDGKNVYRMELPLAEAQAAYEAAGYAGSLDADTLAVCAWDYGLNWTRSNAADESQDFVIEDGVLVGYRGRDLDVVIPEGVTAIGGRAFYNGRITRVTIPSSVKRICDEAFFQASALKDVRITDTQASPSKLTFIGVRAFSQTGIKRIDIPDTVNSVGKQAFASTPMDMVVAGAKTRVDASTFNVSNPKHLVMRGAKSYAASYEATDSLEMRPMETAFFCEGVKSVQFVSSVSGHDVDVQRDDYAQEYRDFFDSSAPHADEGDEKVYGIAPPRVMVIPSTCTQLVFPKSQSKFGMPGYDVETLLRYDPASVAIYAPKNTQGWDVAKAALESIGADPSKQLLPFGSISATTLAEMGATGLAVAQDAPSAFDKSAADAVSELIAALPDAKDLKASDAVKVLAARQAYDKLTESQKALVSNAALLEVAETRLTGIEKAAAEKAAAEKAAADKAASERAAAEKAAHTIGAVKISEAKFVYSGVAYEPAVVVNAKDGSTVAPANYAVTYADNVKAGVASVTVVGKGVFSGSAKATFKIAKAKARAKVLKRKVLKSTALAKKSRAYRAVKLTTDGKRHYKVIKADPKKKLTFKKGKVRVKKGAKPGIYRMRVKAWASAGENYKSLKAKTYSISVKVK